MLICNFYAYPNYTVDLIMAYANVMQRSGEADLYLLDLHRSNCVLLELRRSAKPIAEPIIIIMQHASIMFTLQQSSHWFIYISVSGAIYPLLCNHPG